MYTQQQQATATATATFRVPAHTADTVVTRLCNLAQRASEMYLSSDEKDIVRLFGETLALVSVEVDPEPLTLTADEVAAVLAMRKAAAPTGE